MSTPQEYPQDGEQLNGVYYPEENKDYDQAAVVDKTKKASSYPIIEDLIEWFDAMIKSCDSVDAIDIDSFTINGVKIETRLGIEAQLYGLKRLKELLTTKQGEFKRFLEDQNDTEAR